MIARVRGPTAAASCSGLALYVPGCTSTNTGTRPFWKIGLTVVGKPAATVMTSSPGRSARSPSTGDVSALSASRLADEPELQSSARGTPMTAANRSSNSAANRPVVSQKSRLASTRCVISAASNTLPDTGTGETPGMNGRAGKATSWYCTTSSAICALRASASVTASVTARWR